MAGISLDFHCFKALNNNLEARLFYMFIFMPHLIIWWRVGPCNSDFFKLRTVLTYAFNERDKVFKHPDCNRQQTMSPVWCHIPWQDVRQVRGCDRGRIWEHCCWCRERLLHFILSLIMWYVWPMTLQKLVKNAATFALDWTTLFFQNLQKKEKNSTKWWPESWIYVSFLVLCCFGVLFQLTALVEQNKDIIVVKNNVNEYIRK